MIEQELKVIQKRKRKKKQSQIVIYDEISDLETFSLFDLKARIKQIFKKHIGEKNAISPYDLFFAVFGRNPDALDFFKRMYWWGVIKKLIKQMKRDNECFVINKTSKLFVLQSENELREFGKKVDTSIENLKQSKKNAWDWVHQEKWRDFAQEEE